MSVRIENLEIKGKFKYLWLKYVTGVNLSVHCARCLLGEYSTAVKKDAAFTETIVLDEFSADVFYLCGVALPFVWENNFHLAFSHAPGESFEVDEQNIRCTVRNARRIPITTAAMEKVNHPRIGNKSFSTCRNWQFANQLHKAETFTQNQ